MKQVLDLLFPPKCVFCQRLLRRDETGVCATCLETLPRAEQERTGTWFSVCVSPLRYEGPVREAILRFKFEDRPFYAEPLGALLGACVADRLAGRYDLVSWVPVSRKRLRERGYDQAKLLCVAAAAELGCQPVSLLEKTVHTPAQSGLEHGAERIENVKGVYQAAELAVFAGKRVLLIDDIITTGATLDAAAECLLRAGATAVCGAAVAQTPHEKKE